jgi:hypothetical protein
MPSAEDCPTLLHLDGYLTVAVVKYRLVEVSNIIDAASTCRAQSSRDNATRTAIDGIRFALVEVVAKGGVSTCSKFVRSHSVRASLKADYTAYKLGFWCVGGAERRGVGCRKDVLFTRAGRQAACKVDLDSSALAPHYGRSSLNSDWIALIAGRNVLIK